MMDQPIGIFIAAPLLQSGDGAFVEVGLNAAIPYGRSDTLAAIYRPGESVPVLRAFCSPHVSEGGISGPLWLRSPAISPRGVARDLLPYALRALLLVLDPLNAVVRESLLNPFRRPIRMRAEEPLNSAVHLQPWLVAPVGHDIAQRAENELAGPHNPCGCWRAAVSMSCNSLELDFDQSAVADHVWLAR